MGTLFNVVLYQPFYNFLIALYTLFGDLGIAIIIFTVLIKVVLWPLSKKSIIAQRRMQELKPHIDAIKSMHKGDTQVQNKEMMALYGREKFNPAASCLPMLIQFPVLIAVYNVFTKGINGGGDADLLYSFVHAPEIINHISFGFLDLSLKSVVTKGLNFSAWQVHASFAMVIPFLSAAGQFFQTKMMMAAQPKQGEKPAHSGPENPMEAMSKQMMYTTPFMTLFFGLILPAGLSLYWFIGTLIMIWQQQILFKKLDAQKKIVVPQLEGAGK